MSEPSSRPRPIDTVLRERHQEIRRHVAAGLAVLLLVVAGLSLLMSL